MKRTLLSIAGLFTALVMFTGVVLAAGQIEGGNIYRVRNVTTGGDFTDPANGTCSNTFQFKVRIHNPGPDPISNVNVKATLPAGEAVSHSSTVTIASNEANPTTITDTAGVRLDKSGSLSYVAGTTQLLDPNSSVLSTLPDTILTSGVNIGTVGVSTQQMRFVQFEARVQCSTPPVTISVCDLATKKIVTINEADFNPSKYTKNLAECSATPPTPTPTPTPTPVIGSVIPNTGAEGIAALVAGTSGLAAAGHQLFMRRRK